MSKYKKRYIFSPEKLHIALLFRLCLVLRENDEKEKKIKKKIFSIIVWFKRKKFS